MIRIEDLGNFASVNQGVTESLQTQAGLLGIYSNAAALNLEPMERRAFYAAMEAAGENDLEEISKKIYRWRKALVVLVGDRGVINQAIEELRKNGRARGGAPLAGFQLAPAEHFSREGLAEPASSDPKK